MHPLIAAPLSPDRWPRPYRLAGLILLWLMLAVYFHMPVHEAMAPTLDASNYGSYAYFTARHFQFGTEVVPMAGPYGFIMYGWTYTGELFGLRTAGELALNGTLAALTLWFFCSLRGSPLRWAWLVAHLAFTPYIEDLTLEWILLLGGIYLLQAGPGTRFPWRALLVTAALALVSLIKGTQLILGLATLGVVLGGHAWLRQWRQAALIAAGYVGALLLFWLLAGQNPLHLPAYVRGIMELGGGYTQAMSLPTPPEIFSRALLVSAGLALCLGWALWYRRREALAVATLLLLAGHAFVQWKHSIVRSDGHAYIYFNYAFVAALAIHLAGWRETRDRVSDLVAWRSVGLLLVTLILGNWGAVRMLLVRWEETPRVLTQHLADNAHYLLNLRENRDRLAADLAAERQRHLLPGVRDAVGPRPIDGFGFEQGLLMLNDLNYRPRPMGGGSFNVYTPYLMELNRAFLRDYSRRPDFYLLKLQTIDDRLLAPDDGLALVEILQRYRPVLFEHEHLLLAGGPAAPIVPGRPLSRGSFRFNETINVPAVADHEMVLARINVRPNWRGRIRNALYKPPSVSITALDRQGQVLLHRRIVPGMTSSPFLLSPLLDTMDDLINLYEPGNRRAVAQFRISSPTTLPFAPLIEVEFQAVPRPPALAAPTLAELRGRLQFPFANVTPESITPAFRPHASVRFLHPPAEAVWPLAGPERSFVFHYGIDPEAYERGTTNGVDFFVDLRAPSGATRTIFKSSLQPRKNPADRGDHEARIALPVFAAGSRVVIRTGPGEFGDNSWDWAYVSRIQLKAGGAYPAEFFPGFKRVPDFADAENAAAMDFDGSPVLLLHLPGKIGFNLTGAERQLTLNLGFLPGAYTNGGQTTGGDFIVEVTRAGQPSREIFRRQLQPVATPADRGPQTATVDLTGIAAGDVLTVRTAPVPGGNTSWGWTYLSRLVIE